MKKVAKIVGIIFVVLVILGIVFYIVDKNRAREGQKPIFCIPIGAYLDGGTIEYIGLGYKVIDFNKMEKMVDNTMKYYTKIHIGSWFMTYDSAYEERNNGIVTMQITDVEFVRTYRVISDLQKADQTGNYNYYVIEKFQYDNPIVVRVENKYKLEENTNYEFTFKGGIDSKKTDYSMEEIFKQFRIINIQKTDKEGLEQRQDTIYNNIESNIGIIQQNDKLKTNDISELEKEEYKKMAQEIENMVQTEFDTVVANEHKNN